MSIKDWPGGVISKEQVVPSGPYLNSTASGMWTMDQAASYTKQGIWPTAGNVEPGIESFFSTYLYAGTGSTQTITNGIDLAGEGGLVWIKNRTNSNSNVLFDSERSNFQARLISDGTQSSYIDSAMALQNISSTGFQLSSSVDAATGGSGYDYASWTFRKTPKFFDVVEYTGNGTAGRTISHNLGSVPGFIIVKRLNGADNWTCYHRGVDSTAPEDYTLYLNTTEVRADQDLWADTAPTSTVFSVGDNIKVNGNSSNTYVAYLFAHETDANSMIQCGSYTGNGSTTGPVINLGWEPQWIMVKGATSTSGWTIVDSMRGMTVDGTVDPILYANFSNSEDTSGRFKPKASGFQVRSTSSYVNTSSQTYIYMAIRVPMMTAPTAATDVFAPNFYGTSGYVGYLGAPADMHMLGYRSGNSQNAIVSSRMVQSNKALVTSSNAAEVTANSSWDNMSGVTPVGSTLTTLISWTWKRAKGYMDVVAYNGDATSSPNSRNINHELGVAPEMMWIKCRTAGENWAVYHSVTGATKYLNLNNSVAAATSANWWRNTTPTDTVFTIGHQDDVNLNGGTHIAYLFASLDGISKVGGYTGTGAGQDIDCGFTAGARFALIKRTDATGDWYIWDSVRGISAGNDPYLLLNSSAAEVTNTDYVDSLNAGFTVTSSAPAGLNANGGSYIFYAIA